jgi:hypothetical protein
MWPGIVVTPSTTRGTGVGEGDHRPDLGLGAEPSPGSRQEVGLRVAGDFLQEHEPAEFDRLRQGLKVGERQRENAVRRRDAEHGHTDQLVTAPHAQ